jgi:hypothetical protein
MARAKMKDAQEHAHQLLKMALEAASQKTELPLVRLEDKDTLGNPRGQYVELIVPMELEDGLDREAASYLQLIGWGLRSDDLFEFSLWY